VFPVPHTAAPVPDAPAPEAPAPAPAPAPVPVPVPVPAAPGAHPEAHAAALGADTVTIDGLGSDAAWARATPVAWSTDYAGKPSSISTRARFLWAPTGLYVLFELSGAGFHTDTTKPVDVERKGLYEEDCVELFLTPDAGQPKHYYEIELGPFGHFFDIDVDRERGKQNTAWSSGPRIATHRDPAAHTAAIEAVFGAPEITAALKAGARLPMGLYRIEGTGDRTYLAWSPPRTAKPNFHVPEAFGALLLDP
jgi:hypothetical protein